MRSVKYFQETNPPGGAEGPPRPPARGARPPGPPLGAPRPASTARVHEDLWTWYKSHRTLYRAHRAGDHVPSPQGWGSCIETTRLGIMYRAHKVGDHVPSPQGWGSCTEPTRLGIMYRAHKAGYHVPSPQGWVSCAEPTTLKNRRRRRSEENRRKLEPRRITENLSKPRKNRPRKN